MNNRKVLILSGVIMSLYFLLFIAVSCSTCHSMDIKLVSEKNTYKWYFSDCQENAAALVAHGLNTKPGKMIFIIRMLLKHGISVLNVRLCGHREVPDEIKHVSRDIWVNEINTGFEMVHEYADRRNLPVIFSGFSLGEAAGLDAACKGGKKLFDYALLFAPAVTVRCYTHFIKICYVFGNGFMLPSKTPLSYRANKGTSVAAYKSLFCHIHNVYKSDSCNINVPCICFIDPDDELVGSGRLLSFIQKKKLSNWEVILLKKDKSTAREKYHHLIIDPDSAGNKTWDLIEEEVLKFLYRNKVLS